MKTLLLLSLSLAVAQARPPPPPGPAQSPDLIRGDRSPLLGDSLPAQGHVELEDPAPGPRLDPKEQENLPPGPEGQKDSLSVGQPELKVEPEVKAELKVEPEVKAEPEVKVEPEVKAEQEVKVEPEVKAEPEVKVEPEVKAEPEVKVEPEVKAEPEVKVEPEVKAEPEVKVGPEVKAEPEVKEEPGVKAEPEVKVEPKAKAEVKEEPEVKVEQQPEVNLNPDLMAEADFDMDPDFQVEPEPEENLMFDDLQEELELQTNPETEAEDLGVNGEMVDDPSSDLEPLDDDNLIKEEGGDEELSEVEKSLRAAFLGQDQVPEPLPDGEGDNVLDEEVMVQQEPEMGEEPAENEEVMSNGEMLEEGPALDVMGQPISTLDLFPNEEARMGNEEDSLAPEGSDLLMEEPASEFVQEEENLFLDGGDSSRTQRALTRQKGQSYSSRITVEGKNYYFFKGPLRAEDAELFCQQKFPGGHLASITNQHIHIEVMNMILQHGARRTWIGGLRYLGTGRFIWLDGSQWSYADWLPGEPNHTSNMEDCLELLGFREGNFNDFTCWEPQAFLCSHSAQ